MRIHAPGLGVIGGWRPHWTGAVGAAEPPRQCGGVAGASAGARGLPRGAAAAAPFGCTAGHRRGLVLRPAPRWARCCWPRRRARGTAPLRGSQPVACTAWPAVAHRPDTPFSDGHPSPCTCRPRLHRCRFSLTLWPPPGPRQPQRAVSFLFLSPRGGPVQSPCGAWRPTRPRLTAPPRFVLLNRPPHLSAGCVPSVHDTVMCTTTVSAAARDGGPRPWRWVTEPCVSRRSRRRVDRGVHGPAPRRAGASHAAWRDGGGSVPASPCQRNPAKRGHALARLAWTPGMADCFCFCTDHHTLPLPAMGGDRRTGGVRPGHRAGRPRRSPVTSAWRADDTRCRRAPGRQVRPPGRDTAPVARQPREA